MEVKRKEGSFLSPKSGLSGKGGGGGGALQSQVKEAGKKLEVAQSERES